MDSALVILAVGFLFVGMFAMLYAGYQSSEHERAQLAAARESETATRAASFMTVPGFFVRPEAEPVPLAVVLDDAMVNRLEHHVRLEQALVAQFVHHPSVDNLYREPGTPVHVH